MDIDMDLVNSLEVIPYKKSYGYKVRGKGIDAKTKLPIAEGTADYEYYLTGKGSIKFSREIHRAIGLYEQKMGIENS